MRHSIEKHPQGNLSINFVSVYGMYTRITCAWLLVSMSIFEPSGSRCTQLDGRYEAQYSVDWNFSPELIVSEILFSPKNHPDNYELESSMEFNQHNRLSLKNPFKHAIKWQFHAICASIMASRDNSYANVISITLQKCFGAQREQREQRLNMNMYNVL